MDLPLLVIGIAALIWIGLGRQPGASANHGLRETPEDLRPFIRETSSWRRAAH